MGDVIERRPAAVAGSKTRGVDRGNWMEGLEKAEERWEMCKKRGKWEETGGGWENEGRIR